MKSTKALVFLLLATVLLSGCAQQGAPSMSPQEQPGEAYSISEKSLNPNPKTSRLDYSSLETGSNQFDFESASNSVTSIDLRLGGVYFQRWFDPTLDDADLIEMGFHNDENPGGWKKITSCPADGYERVKGGGDKGEPFRPRIDHIYCLKTSEGNFVKFRVSGVDGLGLDEEPFLIIDWVFYEKGKVGFAPDTAPPVTLTDINNMAVSGDYLVIQFSEPLDYYDFWENLTSHYAMRVVHSSGEWRYAALEPPESSGIDRLVFRLYKTLPGENRAELSGFVTDLAGNRLDIASSWNFIYR